MVTVAMGKRPRSMLPVRRRFCAAGSRARELNPVPGMKVEKRIPLPAGVSLVRKPEALPRIDGIMAARVG
jgi:hypothetical protein